MKSIGKFFSICIIFLLVLFLIGGGVAYENDKNASKVIFTSDDILTKLSTQQLNQVKLSDSDVEGIINSSLSSYNSSKFTLNGNNVIIYPNNAALIKLYLKDNAIGFSTSVSLSFNFTYITEVMDISITKASIGKLPLPLSILRLYLKQNISKLENGNSAIKDIDASNLMIQLDLNSLLAKKQKLLIIKSMSSESNNLILNLSINSQAQSLLDGIGNTTNGVSKLRSLYNSLDNTSKQQVLNFLNSDVSYDKKILYLKTLNIDIDKTTLEKFIESL